MKSLPSSDILQQLVEQQLLKWNMAAKEKRALPRPVITISREPGCNGGEVAKILAGELKLDLYSGKIVEEVANSAKMSASVISTLDERGRSMIEDWIAMLERDRNLWSYQYMHHLVRVMGTIARHGNAIILGRGGTFLIPSDKQLSLRLVAPLEARIRSVMKKYGVKEEEAGKRVALVEAERRSYIRKYFSVDIADPVHYDIVVNTAFINAAAIVDMVKAGLKAKNLA